MPSAASGETLAERAQRFLGLDLDTWLSEKLDSDHVPLSKNRSEQIAQAQRKHRKRTQSYIQALEEEVLRLRGVELAFKEEVKRLRTELTSKHNHSQEEQHQAFTAQPMQETVVIDWEDFYQAKPESACCITAAEAAELEWTADKDTDLRYQLPPVTWADAFDDTPPLSEADQTSPVTGKERTEVIETPLDSEVGVKYILQLERPCLSHLKHASVTEPTLQGYLEVPYNWGTNHAYNLSTRLFHEHRSVSSPRNISITSSDLESLLEASERLELANELTPVQVWALVCKLNTIKPIDSALVASMFEELSKYSYCNSFGSAVSKATIRAAFQHFLGWSHEL